QRPRRTLDASLRVSLAKLRLQVARLWLFGCDVVCPARLRAWGRGPAEFHIVHLKISIVPDAAVTAATAATAVNDVAAVEVVLASGRT
ncbi:hypothetical protein WFJ45_22855, partial [Salmonella enterica subsp. enterica serovar Minnesota]|uniref:hypothetical protein n=1 Tax=Salmonella enterica TaxID=28901 RepID=UPI003D2CF365